jgi:hypothetical protein
LAKPTLISKLCLPSSLFYTLQLPQTQVLSYQTSLPTLLQTQTLKLPLQLHLHYNLRDQFHLLALNFKSCPSLQHLLSRFVQQFFNSLPTLLTLSFQHHSSKTTTMSSAQPHQPAELTRAKVNSLILPGGPNRGAFDTMVGSVGKEILWFYSREEDLAGVWDKVDNDSDWDNVKMAKDHLYIVTNLMPTSREVHRYVMAMTVACTGTVNNGTHGQPKQVSVLVVF